LLQIEVSKKVFAHWTIWSNVRLDQYDDKIFRYIKWNWSDRIVSYIHFWYKMLVNRFLPKEVTNKSINTMFRMWYHEYKSSSFDKMLHIYAILIIYYIHLPLWVRMAFGIGKLQKWIGAQKLVWTGLSNPVYV